MQKVLHFVSVYIEGTVTKMRLLSRGEINVVYLIHVILNTLIWSSEQCLAACRVLEKVSLSVMCVLLLSVMPSWVRFTGDGHVISREGGLLCSHH
jgi:hypothetical protein